MKRKIIFIALALISALLALFIPLPNSSHDPLLILPFSLLSNFILMITGNTTNTFLIILGWVFFLLFSLLPVFFFIYQKLKKRSYPIDYMLVLISFVFGLILYSFLNPWVINDFFIHPLMGTHLAVDLINQIILIYKLVIVSLFYSLVLLYIILRFFVFSKKSVRSLFFVTTTAVMLILMLEVTYSGIIYVRYNWSSQWINNSVLLVTYLGSFLVTGALLYLLYVGEGLFGELLGEEMGESITKHAKKLEKVALIALLVMISENLFVNTYILLFAKKLTTTAFSISFPFGQIIIAVVAYVLAKYLLKVNTLEEENRLTV